MSDMIGNPKTHDGFTIQIERNSQRQAIPKKTHVPDQKWALLGVHGPGVDDVNVYRDIETDEPITATTDETFGRSKELVERRDVLRIRMFIGGEAIDEDFPLPVLDLPGVDPTAAIYEALIRPEVEARMIELGAS